jgi:Topoisomerase 6 subunit A/Spo11, Toprim domain
LTQKAGVSRDLLPRLVLKELTDNSLDAKAKVEVGKLSTKRGYYVDDNGPGIDGTPEYIAYLFSIRRHMVSTKLFRLPTRGAVGNGLRVVAGAVLASRGSLAVITGNKRIALRPEREGNTTVVSVKPVKRPVGTRIEITFGPDLPCDNDTLDWAHKARKLAQTGSTYAGKSSPHWYDEVQFHELLDAAGNRPVRDLVSRLDGCTGGKAGEIVDAAGLGRAICKDVTRQQATKLLKVAQQYAKPVNPKRLGAIGPNAFHYHTAYHCEYGIGDVAPITDIPFAIEAWAEALDEIDDSLLSVYVNRTPVTGNFDAGRDGKDIDFHGGGLHHTVAETTKKAQFDIHLNIITPFMPITSDGKEPNLVPFYAAIETAVGKVARKAHRPDSRGVSQKSIVLDNLDAVIADVSGNGEYRFNARQVFYGLRPIVMEELGEELKISNFTTIITDYEDEHGDIPGMYREPRGSITHPHRNETITLGTLMVEEYERPEWNYNKLAYIEKEGANEALKDNGWLERHDCSVMSSKGYSTRAARDLIDKLAEHDEPITVYAVTDADAYGTMIYQTMQEATKARKARKIKIVHLGLHPWEAITMGLEVETVEVKQNKEGEEKRKPVADYIKAADESGEHGTAPNGDSWEEWLQTHRVELNAMTTPQFIEWLDGKMAEAKDGKLIPPGEVLEAELKDRIEQKTRAAVTERILSEAGLDDQVEAAVAAIKTPRAATLVTGIKRLFKTQPERDWRAHIETVAIERTNKKD